MLEFTFSDYLMLAFIIALIVVIVVLLRKRKKSDISNNTSLSTDVNLDVADAVVDVSPANTVDYSKTYIRKNLLTKNEWSFYKGLKPITDKLNLAVIAKVRLADLVDIKSGLSKSEWQTAFNRINKKHIDFVLCNPDNLYPLVLIELDDNSHKQQNAKQNDEVKNNILEATGYKLLRVQGASGIEEKITSLLNDNKTELEKDTAVSNETDSNSEK